MPDTQARVPGRAMRGEPGGPWRPDLERRDPVRVRDLERRQPVAAPATPVPAAASRPARRRVLHLLPLAGRRAGRPGETPQRPVPPDAPTRPPTPRPGDASRRPQRQESGAMREAMLLLRRRRASTGVWARCRRPARVQPGGTRRRHPRCASRQWHLEASRRARSRTPDGLPGSRPRGPARRPPPRVRPIGPSNPA